MISRRARKLLACGLSLAMIASSFSMMPGQSAAAAKKKKAAVKLSSTKVNLSVGKSKTLKVKKTKVKKIKSIKWSSNKKKIATVNKKGKVTAKKAGVAKITAKVKYIPKGKKKAVTKKLICKVTVKAAVGGNTSATAVPGGNTSATAAPGGSASATPLPGGPTAKPEESPSNIGEPHTITLSDGTTLTIKDNGSVRKEVTAQYLADNEMKSGINLGNTLEATVALDTKRSAAFQNNADRTKYDTAWSQPVTTREYIECLHSYGINTLRLPVAWSNGDFDDGTYTIDPILLDRVEEVANWALDLGMYVIINDHWDNQWWGQFGACKFEYSTDEDGNEVRTKVVDQELRDEAWVRYERYWTQIAQRFQGYSDHLIFEGANEELGGRLNDEIVISDDYKGYQKPDTAGKETVTCGGNLKTEECYAVVNQINQKFVDIIRSSDGNNANRFLLIPGYDTDIVATCNNKDDAGEYMYQMPTDTEENGKNKLFVSLHFYVPTEYALNGGGDYTEEDRATTRELFSYVKRFSDEGYATIIGECAVCEPSDVVGNVITWYTDVFTESAKYHAVPCIWDTGTYFDRTVPCINYKDVAEFLNEWNAANGTTEGVTRETGGGKADPGTKIEIPDYIDKELWEKAGIHAYLFYQVAGTFNFRDAYKPLMNLKKNAHSWDFVSTANESTTVTDVDITDDGLEYTVKIDNFGLSGNKFNMLGVSTNIERKNVYKDLDLKATAVSVMIDGEELLEEEKNMPIKTDDQYADFMVINAYDKVLPQSDFPLGTLNENESVPMPIQSLEITFRIEGIGPVLADIESGEFINPETGLKISETPAEE